MKRIVISAVNFNQGGPLSVLHDCLSAFQKIYKEQDLEITVFVHKLDLVKQYATDFKIIEYPDIKSSWFKRLRFEYYQSKKISIALATDLWIALHDITPNVACKQVVYCHNPSPFYKLNLSDAFTDLTFFLFCLFYRFLYGVNIKKNEFVIVQQQWLREEFERMYNVKTIVAYPFGAQVLTSRAANNQKKQADNKFKFFFPAYARVAKNFEVLLEATQELAAKRNDFEMILTIAGHENKYAQMLYRDYKNMPQIAFIGSRKREEVFELYSQADCMIFPSKLETWGLPITEFKLFNKPMLLANLKYAHETLGEFSKAKFFNPDDSAELATYMGLLIDKKLRFDDNKETICKYPFFKNWAELVLFFSQLI